MGLMKAAVVVLFLATGCKGESSRGPGGAASGATGSAGGAAGSSTGSSAARAAPGAIGSAAAPSVAGAAVPPAGAGSGAAPSALGSAGSGAPVAAGAERFLAAKLDAKAGVVFAERQGGTIDAVAADGTKVRIPDGARVEVTRLSETEMGDSEPATTEIAIDGKRVALPAARVIAEALLKRSPDGAFAVFSVIESCGDACHTALFVIAQDGRRVALGDGAVDVVAAWRGDGHELAVGSGGLWIVALPALSVRPMADYTAPGYAPDGTLYARDELGSGFKLEGTRAKRVWKSRARASRGEEDAPGIEPAPPTFNADGKPVFK